MHIKDRITSALWIKCDMFDGVLREVERAKFVFSQYRGKMRLVEKWPREDGTEMIFERYIVDGVDERGIDISIKAPGAYLKARVFFLSDDIMVKYGRTRYDGVNRIALDIFCTPQQVGKPLDDITQARIWDLRKGCF